MDDVARVRRGGPTGGPSSAPSGEKGAGMREDYGAACLPCPSVGTVYLSLRVYRTVRACFYRGETLVLSSLSLSSAASIS